MSRKKQNVYQEMVKWLETHNGIKPRFQIARDGKRLKTKDMTLEEKRERSLVSRWYRSQEYKVFKACEGIPLEELPPEYEQYKEQIATLRGYEQKKPTVCEEMIQWLETHDGLYPRNNIYKNGKYLKVREISAEEKEEISLYRRWRTSEEYKAFKACEGISLAELPAEYKQYREQIATLRRCEKIGIFEEIIQWLETHDGRYPRSSIFRDGRHLTIEEMSTEERKERNLCARWYRSQEYKAFKACEGISLEELPAEYEQYKERIATLRGYEQIRKEKAAEKRMRKSVAKQVKNNSKTRSELLEVVTQLEGHINEL